MKPSNQKSFDHTQLLSSH